MGWAAIAQFGYSASLKHTEVKVEFDPFVIMGIEDRKDELSDWEASKKGSFQSLFPKIRYQNCRLGSFYHFWKKTLKLTKVIKKIYRELSRTKHPDKLCGVWIQVSTSQIPFRCH